MTVIVADALLFAGFESGLVLVTVAVFVTGPAVCGSVSCSVIVADAAGASVPTLHVTVVVPLQVPAVELAETNVVPGGRTSVTVTPSAVFGPLFVVTIV